MFSRNFDIFHMESQVTRQTNLEKISKNVCYQRNQTTFIDGTLILIFSFRTVLKVRRNLSLEIFYEQKCVQVTRHSLYIPSIVVQVCLLVQHSPLLPSHKNGRSQSTLHLFLSSHSTGLLLLAFGAILWSKNCSPDLLSGDYLEFTLFID